MTWHIMDTIHRHHGLGIALEGFPTVFILTGEGAWGGLAGVTGNWGGGEVGARGVVHTLIFSRVHVS